MYGKFGLVPINAYTCTCLFHWLAKNPQKTDTFLGPLSPDARFHQSINMLYNYYDHNDNLRECTFGNVSFIIIQIVYIHSNVESGKVFLSFSFIQVVA